MKNIVIALLLLASTITALNYDLAIDLRAKTQAFQSEGIQVRIITTNLGNYSQTGAVIFTAYANESCKDEYSYNVSVQPKKNSTAVYGISANCIMNYTLTVIVQAYPDENPSNNEDTKTIQILPDPTPTPPPYSCNDSDNGVNYYLKGIVSGYYASDYYNYTDYCPTQNSLTEYYCVSQTYYSTTYACACSNGACFNATPTPTPPPQNSCNDSDGGHNAFSKGTVEGVYNGFYYSYTDYCNSSIMLMEYVCRSNVWNISETSCGYTNCSNGACVSTPTPNASITPTPSPNASTTPTPNASITPTPNGSTTPSPNASLTPTPSTSTTPTPAPTPTQSVNSEKLFSLKIEMSFVEKTSLTITTLNYETNERKQKVFANAKNAVTLELEKGVYEINALAETSGGKTFLAKPIEASVFQDAALSPEFSATGSLTVSITSKENESVSNAVVQAVCPGWKKPFHAKNSSTPGEYEFELLPANVSCLLLAGNEENGEQMNVSVKEGKQENISIRFEIVAEKNVVENTLNIIPWLVALAIITTVAGYLYYKKIITKPLPPTTTLTEQAVNKPTNGKNAVIKTLNEREATVTNYLLEHGSKASQGKIRFALLIPKTSFFRVIDSLQAKNIVQEKKDGNYVEISLTDWFKNL